MLRFLRGTPFDPLQLIAHRRLERRLIRDYETTVDELVAGLSRDNLDLAVEVAALPEGIRGFAVVKARTVDDAKSKQNDLLAEFRLRAAG